MSVGRFLVQTLLPDATTPTPHANGKNRRQRQEPGEAEPALDPCRGSPVAGLRLDLPRPGCALNHDGASRTDEHDPGRHEPRCFRRAPEDLG